MDIQQGIIAIVLTICIYNYCYNYDNFVKIINFNLCLIN